MSRLIYTQLSRRWSNSLSSIQRRSGCYSSSHSLTGQGENHPPAIVSEKQKRVPRTLYRQLLRWCQSTAAAIPLEAFIDPVSFTPPQIDEDDLIALSRCHGEGKGTRIEGLQLISRAYALLPSHKHLDDSSLMVAIRNTDEMRNLIRAVFRLNAKPAASEEIQRERIAYAFQSLRALNQLTEAFEDLNKHRESHRQRDDSIHFHIGQVVQHRQERWRGVVVDWEKPVEDVNPTALTSLTTKAYTAEDFLGSVRYEVLLDVGDVQAMGATAQRVVSTQGDLEAVTDPSLCRIRNGTIAAHFTGYEARSRTFLMNDMLAYEYPCDHDIQQQKMQDGQPTSERTTVDIDMTASDITSKVESFRRHLCSFISLSEGEDKNDEKWSLLQTFHGKLASKVPLASHHQGRLPFVAEDSSPVASAVANLRHLLNIILEVRDLLGHRKALQTVTLPFSLGDIVYNKFFGYRGVIVGVEPRPPQDITRWDGVQHLDPDSIMEQPLYYVMPDQNDCNVVFAGPRGMRYVCQTNLESCLGDRRAITVPLGELELGWKLKGAADQPKYEPPSHVKFKHGQCIDDGGLTERCLTEIQDELALWLVGSRNSAREPRGGQSVVDIDFLFPLLQSVAKMEDAIAIEETIKETFKSHTNPNLREHMEEGITEIIRGRTESALTIFESLVEEDNDYGEAWNKVAACRYMLGRHSTALEACDRATELLPKNFQTHSGAGLCFQDTGRYEEAEAAFRRCLELDPWSPISTKLAYLVDIRLQKQRPVESKMSTNKDWDR